MTHDDIISTPLGCCKYVLENENHFEHCDINKESNIYKSITSHFVQNEAVCVSLSGGVDSMVLICVLKEFCKCTALHINYRNRHESDAEQLFLEKWCLFYGIPIQTHTMSIIRSDCDRKTYEKETNTMRYSFYKKNCGGSVLLGHHKNDIVENTISNIMSNKSIFDMHNMVFKNTINEVIVKRPLLGFFKNEIEVYSLEHMIPHFKDTTPSWSVRGRLRNNLFKPFKSMYPLYDKSLYNLASECLTWRDIVQEYIIDPMITKVIIKDDTLIIPNAVICDKPIEVWKKFFAHLFHRYACVPMISNKSLNELYERFSTNQHIGSVHLRSGIVAIKGEYHLTIYLMNE
jgi:tRNA(Ile)-lysidine synthetase-like protein